MEHSRRVDRDFCASSYLAFRHVVEDGVGWKPGVFPVSSTSDHGSTRKVSSPGEVGRELTGMLAGEAGARACLFLSGGMDSAILARLVPGVAKCFTIRFSAEGAVDESEMAAVYADRCRLPWEVVEVTWPDHDALAGPLMARKNEPLHAVEVGLHRCALEARRQGFDTVIVGNGADSNFGGLDGLLARDWTIDEFVTRYTFVDPEASLRNPVSMRGIFGRYDAGGTIDLPRFLREVHGRGITRSFENAILGAGCRMLAPYESLELGVPLDIERIRSGEPKYVLRELFADLYPDLDVPGKIPFARPMDLWLSGWEGPGRPEFLPDLDASRFTGDQRWLLYCLERFLEMHFS